MNAVVETRGLCKQYGPALRVNHLDLTVPEGAVYGFLGPNGAGKSTLLKLMVGLLKPASGDIRLNGESIHRKKTEDLSRQISLVYQNPEQMFIKDSIRADIAFAMEARGV